MLAHRLAVAVLVVSLFGASAARSQDCAPEIVNTFDTPGDTKEIVVQGNLAAVADHFPGTRIMDISDPARPRQLSRVPAQFGARDVVVSGDLVAVIDQNPLSFTGNIQIIDIADPFRAVLASEIRLSFPLSPGGLALWDGSKVAFGVVNLQLGDGTGIRIYDISDPASPVILSTIEDVYVNDIVYHDGLLFVAGSDVLFRFDFMIYNVADPSAPELVAILPIDARSKIIAVSDNLAFVTTREAGVHIIDISDPANPEVLSNIDTPDEPRWIKASGSTAYVSFGFTPRGLSVIDASDPSNPVSIGIMETKNGPNGLAIVNDHYILLGESGGSIHTIDISTCEPCPADLDGDTDLDADDFFLYLDAFANGNTDICDIDQDADCDGEDFFAYLDLFAAGC